MKNKGVLSLNRKIYSKSVIDNAVKAFTKIAVIHVSNEEDKFICKFVKSKYEMTKTIYEFENYIIGLSNRNGDLS